MTFQFTCDTAPLSADYKRSDIDVYLDRRLSLDELELFVLKAAAGIRLNMHLVTSDDGSSNPDPSALLTNYMVQRINSGPTLLPNLIQEAGVVVKSSEAAARTQVEALLREWNR